jgi:formylglycine-generating enzyme required for sulfatase activity
MGSTDNEEGGYENELPQHRVTIAQRFAIGRYPVTFDEYDRFCEARRREKPDDQGWGREQRPVINVGWNDAQDYLAWLSQEIGRAYRLPSEAEWEYACRAGTTTRFWFGESITPKNANYNDSGLGRTSEIGAYPANGWGLHDMDGHVWEWVEDDWHELPGSADGRIDVEERGSRPDSAPLRFARRLLEQLFVGLPVRLPHLERRRQPGRLHRVPGGPNTFLILEP